MSTDSGAIHDLCDLALQGDGAALAALFDGFRERLERTVLLRMDPRIQGRVDPADIVQDAYLEISKRFTKYYPASRLPLFLWFRLEVMQKLVDFHRFHLGAQMRDVRQEISISKRASPDANSRSIAANLLGRLTSASQAAMRLELQQRVQEALDQMSPRDREVLVLRHFEELSNAETAQLLDLSPTAACNRYVRALKRLTEVLQDMPGGMEGFWK
jgi:RNA polymerase sigma-70 factor (ECF subfamily)